MGVPPLLGRTPTADDARPGAEPVVVLGYRFWQRQFGGDPHILGRQLRLNETMRTVIGVMPKRFMWRGADVYIPLRFERGQVVEGVRGVHLLGRLKPGVTDAQAEADLRPIIADLKKQYPTEFPDTWRVGLLRFTETFPSGITGDIWVLFGAVALLLLIACANVSNLLLSKAAARQKEMSVRVALGASRSRLIRQLLTESLLLALVAGALGSVLAYAGLPAILAIVPPGTIPDESEIALNRSVLVFTLGICAMTSVMCGLAPALHSSRRDLAASMREVSRSLVGRFRPGNASQVAGGSGGCALVDAPGWIEPPDPHLRRHAAGGSRLPAGAISDAASPARAAAIPGCDEASRILSGSALERRDGAGCRGVGAEHWPAPARQHVDGRGSRRHAATHRTRRRASNQRRVYVNLRDSAGIGQAAQRHRCVRPPFGRARE